MVLHSCSDAHMQVGLESGDVKLEVRSHVVEQTISHHYVDNPTPYTLFMGMYERHMIRDTPTTLHVCHRDDVTVLTLSEDEDEDQHRVRVGAGKPPSRDRSFSRSRTINLVSREAHVKSDGLCCTHKRFPYSWVHGHVLLLPHNPAKHPS